MNIAAWIQRRREETAETDRQIRALSDGTSRASTDRQIRMFGVTVDSMEDYAKFMGAPRTIANHALSMMSDAQEAANLGKADHSRRLLNCAKWYLQRVVNSLPRVD